MGTEKWIQRSQEIVEKEIYLCIKVQKGGRDFSPAAFLLFAK